MKFISLKSAALTLAAFTMISSAANADTARKVQCANGRTVEASGTQSDAEVCLLVASIPATDNKPGNQKFADVSFKRGRMDELNARKYEQLARAHKPRTPTEERLVKQYMKLPPSQRDAFESAHPDVSKSIWDLGPYAVCFYASVAGGADVVEAGDECHEDWVE